LLDTFHMNIEEPDPLAAIAAAGERVFHFHVADSNRHPPGGGHLDFGRLLSGLAATGYDAWVSGEFLPRPDAMGAAAQGLAHLRAVRSQEP
jgi:sugar phosphate isomerase/epimerase